MNGTPPSSATNLSSYPSLHPRKRTHTCASISTFCLAIILASGSAYYLMKHQGIGIEALGTMGTYAAYALISTGILISALDINLLIESTRSSSLLFSLKKVPSTTTLVDNRDTFANGIEEKYTEEEEEEDPFPDLVKTIQKAKKFREALNEVKSLCGERSFWAFKCQPEVEGPFVFFLYIRDSAKEERNPLFFRTEKESNNEVFNLKTKKYTDAKEKQLELTTFEISAIKSIPQVLKCQEFIEDHLEVWQFWPFESNSCFALIYKNPNLIVPKYFRTSRARENYIEKNLAKNYEDGCFAWGINKIEKEERIKEEEKINKDALGNFQEKMPENTFCLLDFGFYKLLVVSGTLTSSIDLKFTYRIFAPSLSEDSPLFKATKDLNDKGLKACPVDETIFDNEDLKNEMSDIPA